MADLNLCITDPVSGDILERFSICSSFMSSPGKQTRMICAIQDAIRQEFDVVSFVPKEAEAEVGLREVVYELREMNRCLYEIQNSLSGLSGGG